MNIDLIQFDLSETLSIDLDKVPPINKTNAQRVTKINKLLETLTEEARSIEFDTSAPYAAVKKRLKVIESHLIELENLTWDIRGAEIPESPLYHLQNCILILDQWFLEWDCLLASDIKRLSLMAWKMPIGTAKDDIRYKPLINLRHLLDAALEPERVQHN